ncbi:MULTISPECIES: PDDEXK-like family protein [unclassified Pseudoalteromonas]|uniref:PDDEXK-like family protein n=1 Tax=unclassified Pseudoalteromonas TaxID=194690 RepID=UPI0006CA1A53|nr:MULTISPECIES: PD-(D/E)XK nuclease family protein [unclassified Pseudoalteromonas]KPM78618.1 hypothetical protein AOG26_03685 [Pseudoalteromonas sp. UCD-33C]KPZ66962.1 hypothetical protein AN394_04048 [Pseudoalteromonas sp. P1-26]
MINNHFFKLVSLIKKTYYKPDSYNLFTVLRSESDEVRLHSRFLASLLNPKETHGRELKFLKELMKILEVEGFDLSNVEVINEYKNIDIYIKNDRNQAIIIENKIYADDQDNQLNRYFQTAISEGINKDNLWFYYLTLNGHEPLEQSVNGIPIDFLAGNKFNCISYQHEIKKWLTQSVGHAALNPPVRESISQYTDLISKLSGINQNEQYMKELKNLLLADDNMLYVNDIKQAYIENLIDIQNELWIELVNYQKKYYPELGELSEDSISNEIVPKDVISNYYTSSRNNKYYGLYFPLKESSAYISLEIAHQMCIGIWCNKTQNPKEHKELSNFLRKNLSGSTSEWWPIWRYTQDGINFKNPNTESVAILVDKESRAELVKTMIDDLYVFWTEATSFINGNT